jgi:non-ribosomal peptide synthetase-like protein
MNLVSPIDTRALYADEGAPDPKLLHEFFEFQATVRPAHPAVECGGETFTYKRLDRMSNRIAHWLHERGIGPGAMVGICMEKSCRLYAAILGVLKAGGAYVPIDPKFPIDRIKSILEDAGMQIVITSGSELDERAVGQSITLLALDADANQVSRQPRQRLSAHQVALRSDDPCYVIYTSGSTGKPKGVVIEHRNAVNFVHALKATYRLEAEDRIYQGFSVAFDASVEEIWGAFALGGTLVVPPDLVARSPFDACEFISRNGVTFFSTVPTFLSMMDGELPSVRLLVVGGEECAAELVSRWAPGRRMLNTYGPTETTVVATAAECVAGETVTIGRPLPGYMTRVLNDRLEPVPDGEPGELFIGGESVARGYVNMPQLNAERFICDGSLDEQGAEMRFFRTHDVVRVTKTGALEFLGRNDQLIKIRGFRVELSEIEAVLMEYPFARAAVVNTLKHGETVELAAYIVPERDLEADDRRRIVELLRRRLPDYMIPRYLDVLEELPTMLSGKVDRKLLPAPQMLLASEDREAAPPATPMERTIVESFERCFGVSPIFATDDFFRDLGGHSHTAGRVATDLRAKLGTNRICVRDFYAHRTARHLAQHLEQSKLIEFPNMGKGDREVHPPAPTKEQGVGTVARWTCGFVQALVILALHAAVVSPVLFVLLLAIDVLNGTTEWWRAAQIASTFALFIWPAWLLIGIAVKWIVIGRFKPGRYPLWGSYYLRWWIVDRFQSIGWSAMFMGTPLMSLYYRAMGAKVGANCTISTPYCGAFDLLSIGEGTSVGADTHILGYRVEDGHLILGRITIGDDCFVGVHCNLGLNATMEDRASLDDMSMLPDGAVIGRGQSYRGSPAAPGSVKLPGVVTGRESRLRRALFGVLHLCLIYVMGYLLLLGIVPGLAFTLYCLQNFGMGAAVAAAFAALPLSGLWWLSIVLTVKWLVLGRIRSGTYRLTSGAYLRIWFLRYMLDNTRHLLNPIYATMFTPLLLRLLGAKIGRRAEVSTVMHVVPDLIELGEGSFLADACMVGGPRIYRGWIEVSANKIGSRSFVGNSAFAPSGVELGVNSLVGVMSAPPSDRTRTPDGTRWLGSPSFELHDSTKPAAAGQGDESRTYRPTFGLVLYRGLMELLRMLLPAVILTACLAAFVYLIAVCYAQFATPVVLLIAPVATLALSLALIAASAGVKWLLVGTFRPTVRPLWCAYVWRNEIVNGVYETLAANAMSPLLGTPFAAPALRLMGCKIGREVFLQTTLFSEFDLVKIGDRAALNLGSTIQTHLFEDRMMKADTLEIGDGCSIGNMSVVLYGAKMQGGSSLGPMSLLMKGETLPAATRWHGIPTEPVRSASEVHGERSGASEAA